MIQGDVFCFTKLEEALIEVNFVIEAVHEDLEDKKSLLESKTIITKQFLSTYTQSGLISTTHISTNTRNLRN